MRILHHLSSALLLGMTVAGSAAAQSRTQVVAFADGATTATETGEIRGYEAVTYTLEARGGQSATFLFKPNNGECEFLVYRPDQTPGQNEAFFNGSSMGNEFSGILPASGTYSVWVGLNRTAARGLQTCNYTIRFSITGGAS